MGCRPLYVERVFFGLEQTVSAIATLTANDLVADGDADNLAGFVELIIILAGAHRYGLN